MFCCIILVCVIIWKWGNCKLGMLNINILTVQILSGIAFSLKFRKQACQKMFENLKEFGCYDNTSYALGKDGNLLPAGSGLRRPKAKSEVCEFHFPRALNSNLFLKHMKYYFHYMVFDLFICWKCYSYLCKRYLIEIVIHSLKPNDVCLFNNVTNVQKKIFIYL